MASFVVDDLQVWFTHYTMRVICNWWKCMSWWSRHHFWLKFEGERKRWEKIKLLQNSCWKWTHRSEAFTFYSNMYVCCNVFEALPKGHDKIYTRFQEWNLNSLSFKVRSHIKVNIVILIRMLIKSYIFITLLSLLNQIDNHISSRQLVKVWQMS